MAGSRAYLRVVVVALLCGLSVTACSSSSAAGGPKTAGPTTSPAVTEPPPPAVPHPFGLLDCVPEYGIRFCKGGQQGSGASAKDLRVPSFDGVPLDADVALPATGRGPFPLIVMLNGLGGSKTDWERTTDDHGIDDVTFASMGYAVLMYTARGFGDSCGTASSRAGTPACDKGWIHLADQRYEIRDTQYLAGMLVDEGIARPAIAVTGVSYGGGQSLELAMLKNRVREPDGTLVPWTSPRLHVPMRVAVVYAEWPWDDLVSALVPNGWQGTAEATPPSDDITPIGVEKFSWNDLLYHASDLFFVAPKGADPGADLTDWYDVISAGPPYPPSAEKILEQLQEYHSALGVPMPAGGPAPTVLQNGWTDTLFPVSEGLQYADRIAAAGYKTSLLMIFDDVGHGWAQSKPADVARQTAAAIAFLNAVMLGHGSPRTGVIASGTTCPASAASAPVLTAATYDGLSHGSLTFGSAKSQVVTSSGGSASESGELNPAYFSHYCQELSGATEPGTAVYRLVVSHATTVVGGLQVHAQLEATGSFPFLIARLWDLNPATGRRQLIEAGPFRLAVNQSKAASGTTRSESVTFDLPPNLYTVPAHHVIELELLGNSSPWFLSPTSAFRITVSGLSATIGLAAGA